MNEQRAATKDEYRKPNRGIGFNFQKPKWRWSIFGAYRGIGGDADLMTIETIDEVPFWHRLLTRIFLRSTWTRLP